MIITNNHSRSFIKRLAITKDEIHCTSDEAIFEVMLTTVIVQCILMPIKVATIKCCLITTYPQCHCLLSLRSSFLRRCSILSKISNRLTTQLTTHYQFPHVQSYVTHHKLVPSIHSHSSIKELVLDDIRVKDESKCCMNKLPNVCITEDLFSYLPNFCSILMTGKK